VKVLALGLTALLFAVSCGGGSSPASGGDIPGINIHVDSPTGPTGVDVGQVVPVSVTVTNDSGDAGVIWSVAAQQKGNPAGTFMDIKPDSVTYQPPDGITAAIQITVTATSVTDPTRAAAIPISVYPAPTITTPPSALATAFLNTDYACVLTPITNIGVTQIPCQVSVAGGQGPYTWTIEGNAGFPDGMFLGRGLTANDTAIVGKPTLAGIYPFTLRVTDSLGGTNTVALTINVAPSQLKVVTPTVLTTKVGVPYSPVQLQVSGGVPPYTWSLANGSQTPPPGMTLSPAGVIAGTPTDASQSFIAVRVVDSQIPVPAEAIFPTPAPSRQKIITLTPSSQEPECFQGGSGVAADTPYAFFYTGFDADGPVIFAGSFTADSRGNITSGVEDVVRSSGTQLAQPLTTGGSVVFDNGGRGCMLLTTATGSTAFRSAPTTRDTVTSFFRDGRMVEFDDADGTGTRGTGSFRIQDGTVFSTALTGPYVFRLSGHDNNGGHFAAAGQVVMDSGVITSMTADVNNAGALAGPIGGTGTFSGADVNGRGTATIGVGSQVLDLIYYVVDANHLIFASSHRASPGHPAVTGEATLGAGPFSESSLSDSDIYRLGGAVHGTPDLNIGVLHFDGVGGLSGVALARAGGSPSSTSLAGNYAIDPTLGRVTFSGTAIPAVGYLALDTNGLTAYLVGTGASAASGVMEFQTDNYPPGYEFNPVTRPYGFVVDEMFDPLSAVFVGNINVDNTGTNGGLNDSYLDGSSALNGLLPFQNFELFTMTFGPDGSGTFGGNTYMVTNGHKVFYIDISPLNSHPAIVVGQQIQ
jgi:hypothetical protein